MWVAHAAGTNQLCDVNDRTNEYDGETAEQTEEEIEQIILCYNISRMIH